MDRKNEACEKVLNSIKKVLIEKNKRYGNAALEPLGVFYKGDAGYCCAVHPCFAF